jgi:TolB-like protein/Tfp pilus assembly protein PilF
MLLERNGEVVSREEIVNKLWGDGTFVDFDQSLGAAVSKLRRALGDTAATPRYVETVRQKGFRLLVPVQSEEARRNAGEQPGRRFTRAHAGAAVVLLVLVGVWIWWTSKRPAQASMRSLAVLPFRILNPAEPDRYLELGIPDALITSLSHLRQVAVRPTSAVRGYAGREVTALAAGRQLNVDAVLEGTIQRLGGRLRVTVQLVRIADGQSVWAEKFDERMNGIFEVQDTIARRVAAALAAQITPLERAGIEKRYTSSTEAFQAYEKGRYLWNQRTGDGLERSVAFFEQAISLDPNYALAYAGLADAYVLMNLYRSPSRHNSFLRAKEAVGKALALDPELAQAQASLAFNTFYYDWDWPAAEVSFRRAIELNPNYATAHQWYAEFLYYQGRFSEASAEIRQAYDLDPQSVVISVQLASPYFYSRQWERAMEGVREAMKLDSSFPLAIYVLGCALTEMGRYGEAVRELRPIEGTDLGLSALGYAYAKSGQLGRAREVLAKMLRFAREDKASPYQVACLYANVGALREAFVWLEKARLVRDYRMVMLRVDSKLDPLRSDSRFRILLEKMNLQ